MNYENDYANRERDGVVTDSDTEIASETDSDSDSASIAGSDSSAKRLTKAQAMREQKMSDPDYYKVVRRANNKTMTIEMYSTRCNPGVFIRDPRFGTRYSARVGTLAEHYYFKVRMTSVGDGCEPVTLFYDSPEGYEKHQRTRVSREVKQAWRTRYASLSPS